MTNSNLTTTKLIDNIHFTGTIADIKQPFNLRSMGHFICNSNYFTKRDGLEECLVILTLNGCGCMEYHNEKVQLKPESVVVINCKESQCYYTVGDLWDFVWIHFYGEYAIEFERLINQGSLFCGHTDTALFLPIYENIKKHALTPSTMAAMQISLELNKAMVEILALREIRLEKDIMKRINNVNKFISSNFTENLDISFLASMCGFSKFYFIKLYKSFTGTTPHQYIIGIRISEAKRLLIASEHSIGTIAELVGFSDDKSFIINFKKNCGITPLQYRKNYSI